MVKWTNHALIQLQNIYNYIEQDSPLYAERVSNAIVHKTIGLDDLPHLGRKVSELDNESIRELSLYSYRIIYEIKPEYIEVLALIHKRQNFKSAR